MKATWPLITGIAVGFIIGVWLAAIAHGAVIDDYVAAGGFTHDGVLYRVDTQGELE